MRISDHHKTLFEAKLLTLPSGCIEWQGARYHDNYGKVRINSRIYATHRVAYELYIAPIPRGKHVLHTCDNPACCNPEHLFVGTRADNMKDMIAKGRQGKPTYTGIKLTKSDAREIRKLNKDNVPILTIAHMFDISPRHTRDVINGIYWKETNNA